MKKITLLFLLLFTSGVIAQGLVFENTYINAHDVQAYDNYIENVLSKVKKQRIDAGITVD